ncbi:MAG: glycosyltransferase family 1 protein [Sphingobacteriales bacterium]|nr:MAG: glycosyltransferase family 1 protein [Sphingobacteriales bacterium]
MRTDTLFLTLNVFSATGGIEKVCKILGKALYERSVEKEQRLMVWSMHDKEADVEGNLYFPGEIYKCFHASKARFVSAAVQQGLQSKLVILSHTNLLLVGWLIKKLSPKTKIVLLAHGIEIWNKFPKTKRRMLAAMDQVWAVSRYTKTKILEQQGLTENRVSVLNNCLDPFLTASKNVIDPAFLKSRYGLAATDKILFTLTRLSSKEKYKGYDDVITALEQINDPSIKYIIGGKADDKEITVVNEQVDKAGLKGKVILAGFIAENEVAAHYKMSDCYIMPSSGEGFGVSFIEAMFYGVPVIGGNADGSRDALQNGELGTAVRPGNIPQIKDAIKKIMDAPEKHKPDHEQLMNHFGYPVYKERLGNLLAEVIV